MPTSYWQWRSQRVGVGFTWTQRSLHVTAIYTRIHLHEPNANARLNPSKLLGTSKKPLAHCKFIITWWIAQQKAYSYFSKQRAQYHYDKIHAAGSTVDRTIPYHPYATRCRLSFPQFVSQPGPSVFHRGARSAASGGKPRTVSRPSAVAGTWSPNWT